MKSTSPATFKKCPLRDEFSLNLTASGVKNLIDVFPTGYFQIKASLHTNLDKQLVAVNYTVTFLVKN